MIVAQVFVVVQVNNNEIKFIQKKKEKKRNQAAGVCYYYL